MGILLFSVCFCFKQKTAYEMRISDWSSDVCSSDLRTGQKRPGADALLVIVVAQAGCQFQPVADFKIGFTEQAIGFDLEVVGVVAEKGLSQDRWRQAVGVG